MLVSILPKFIFEDEDILILKTKGVQLEECKISLGSYLVNCYKFYNLNETQVFDKLESQLVESAETERINFGSRAMAVIFLELRNVNSIKDKETKIAATCGLLAAVNSLAAVSVQHAQRFLALIRGIN